eukprot:196782-Amphidinium_carterae.1
MSLNSFPSTLVTCPASQQIAARGSIWCVTALNNEPKLLSRESGASFALIFACTLSDPNLPSSSRCTVR